MTSKRRRAAGWAGWLVRIQAAGPQTLRQAPLCAHQPVNVPA